MALASRRHLHATVGKRWLALALATFAGCLEYSPHALPTDASERDLNQKAIARLNAQTPAGPAPFRFAVLGDIHNSYDELDAAVDRVNAMEGIELVVQVGDFTHLGMLQEFRLSREKLDRLRVPYVVAIGNHDMLGRGGAIYDRMFGPRDLSFVHRNVRFVLLDTNSREYGLGAGVPRLGWLAGELRHQAGAPAAPASASRERTLVFGHVPPISTDFDPDAGPSYHSLLRDARVAGAFYGHEHGYAHGERETVPFWISDSLQYRSLLVVTVGDEAIRVEQERF